MGKLALHVKYGILLGGFLCLLHNANSQTNKLSEIQYGVAVKATIDLGTSKYFKYSNYNIAVAGGVGVHPFEYAEAYPSIHGGFLLYNRGDLISSYQKGFFNSTCLDLFMDFSLTMGYYTSNTNYVKRFVPLYHFADFTPNPLQNPYQHSLTIGTNVIWLFGKYKQELPQRIGFTGVMIDRRFQLSTYNDGSVWSKTNLADGLDRYYTGGGAAAYHLNHTTEISNLELSFHKFTGHEKYVFDTANLLQIDHIPFQHPETYYYSKSRFRLSVTSLEQHAGVHITFHNTDKDPQDWIHFTGDDTYHPDVFDNHPGLGNELKRIGIGGFWLYHELNPTN